MLDVRVSSPPDEVVVVLTTTTGEQYLAMVVGAREGVAIASSHIGIEHSRPMTHDLFARTLETMGIELSHVFICGQRAGVYLALLVAETGETVDARPSDAIALAQRLGIPIMCDDGLLAGLEDSALLDQTSDEPASTEAPQKREPDHDEQVSAFRNFLDSITADDFDAGQ